MLQHLIVANFFLLPRELRDMVYELCLLHQEPININFDYNTPRLLHVNEIARHEASSLFYTQNSFDFSWAAPERIASFLKTIGRNNADYIQHVCVDFPVFHYQGLNDATLSDGSVSIFTAIQSSCSNLRTLTVCAYSSLTTEGRLEELDNHGVVTKVLKLIDTRFRAISSLKKIIVGVYDDDPRSFITEMAFARSLLNSHKRRKVISGGDSFDPRVFEELLIEWIAVNSISFKSCESTQFKALLVYLNENANNVLPTRNTLRTWSIQQYNTRQKALLLELSRVTQKIHLSIDLWSSGGFAYIGVIAHYFDQHSQPKAPVLIFCA
jgi:hypothetical protein